MDFHLFRIVQPVLFVIIAGLVPDYSLACDYQRVDPSHTMCVYHPRSCAGKTLIRKYIYMHVTAADLEFSHRDYLSSQVLAE